MADASARIPLRYVSTNEAKHQEILIKPLE